MLESAFIGSLALLFASWYSGIFCISRILEARHPEVFERLGQPTRRKEILPRLWNQSSDQYLFGFILAREHVALCDARLSKISDMMLFVFWLFIGTIFLSPLAVAIVIHLF